MLLYIATTGPRFFQIYGVKINRTSCLRDNVMPYRPRYFAGTGALFRYM